MAYENGISQRKNMAMGNGGASGDFGCSPMDSCKGAAMSTEAEMTKEHTTDGDRRGAGMPVKHTRGKLPSQAAPDHGRHSFVGEMP